MTDEINRKGDAEVIVATAREAATRAAHPVEVDPTKLYVTLDDGVPAVLDLEDRLPWPRAKRGAVTIYTPPSFVQYVNRHAGEGSTLWADVEAARVVAVLDDHEPDKPGWGLHRAVLALRHPPAWVRWMGRNGRIGTQAEFAEHVEDSLPEIVEPDGAAMLELAQTFHATGSVVFRSDQRLATGAVQLTYEQTHEARAGERGQMEIPQRFVVALAPFEGLDPFRVDARLRYRLREGELRIGYVLDRPEEVLRAAFHEIVEQLGSETDRPVLQGTPRS